MKILKQQKELLLVLLIAVFAVWQIRYLWKGYWFSSHDAVFHVIRAEEMYKMLKMGFFPVRWGLNLDNGFGVPIFNYVYPGPHYLSAFFQLLGLNSVNSMKVVFSFFYILGGVGFYMIYRKKDKWLAVVAGLLYLVLPYQFLDIFVRGSYGEACVLGLMPWAFWTIKELKTESLKWYHPVPLALMQLCHNFLGIIFLAWLVIYVLVSKRLSKKVCLSLVLSMGLVAFFLIPMVGERNLISSGRYSNFTYDYKDHFVYPKQLVYSKWEYWYSEPGLADGMSFQLGLAGVVTVVLGLLVVFKNKNFDLIYYLISYIGVVFLMLPYSDFIWQKISLLQIVQFPWRFLFLTTFLTPLLMSFIYKNNKILLIFLLVIALINSRNYKRPQMNWSESEYQQSYNLYKNGATTTDRKQVAPYWAKNELFKLQDIDGVESEWKNRRLSFEIDGDKRPIVINYNYFPAWRLISEGKKVNIYPTEDGRIGFETLLGKNKYELELISTPIEKTANLISGIGVLGVVCLGLTRRKSRI